MRFYYKGYIYLMLWNKDPCRLVFFAVLITWTAFFSCKQAAQTHQRKPDVVPVPKNISFLNLQVKVIHVFVALCDNKYQGIIPVPPNIGNGQDPVNNLYWGARFGIKTFFEKSVDWKLIKTESVSDMLLERSIFLDKSRKFMLVADAYNGKNIRQTTVDFLNSCAGRLKDTLQIGGQIIGIDGNASLLAYIGHDGLMDFSLPPSFRNQDGKVRDCIVLACTSKTYFGPFLQEADARPLILTSGLMCPEAYTLHDAIEAYKYNAGPEQVRLKAVYSYDKYQKCGVPFANRLLVSGL
jgi:hypothetical protein